MQQMPGRDAYLDGLLGSPYRSGRTDHWVKVKNPEAPARCRAEFPGFCLLLARNRKAR